MDWTVLEIDGVLAVCEQAATKVGKAFDLDIEDLEQEARIRACDTTSDHAKCVDPFSPKLGMLQYQLEKDLVDLARTMAARRARNTSFEERYDDSGDDAGFVPKPVAMQIRTDFPVYTRELVEALLPAVWDEAFCYGMRAENAPDQDMPRAAPNKATNGTLEAHIADIKRGWKQASLTVKERRALLLTYGLDWTPKDAAFNQDRTRQVLELRTHRAVGKVMARLNGDLMAELTLCESESVAA